MLSSHRDLGKVKSQGSSFTGIFLRDHLRTCKIFLLEAVISLGELLLPCGCGQM